MSELLAVDDHLAGCAACRAVVSTAGKAGKLTLDDPDSHLTYEQLEAIVEGRAAADEHARECAMCAAELRDLRALAERRRWSRAPWWLPVGAAVAASIALAVFLTGRPGVPVVQAPVRTASIRDGALTLSMDAAGRITDAPFEAAAVNAALASGDVAAAPGVRDWRRDREQLLGDPAGTTAGAVIAPVAETVAADRPVFRWTPVKGATSYRVEVYDASFNEVAASGPVPVTEWRPERPLPRGAAYSWIVAAGDLRFPQPPAPEARFEVLGAEAAAEVERARSTGSRLLVAVAAARHGLWEEARAAIAEVAAQNPTNDAIARLRLAIDTRAKNSSRTR